MALIDSQRMRPKISRRLVSQHVEDSNLFKQFFICTKSDISRGCAPDAKQELLHKQTQGAVFAAQLGQVLPTKLDQQILCHNSQCLAGRQHHATNEQLTIHVQ